MACAEGLADGSMPNVSDAFLSELYGLEAWIFAGCSDDEVATLGQRIYREELVKVLYQEVVELVHWLREESVRVCVLSGSMRGALLGATRELGFRDEDVFGSDCLRDDEGRYLAQAKTLFGEAKGKCVDVLSRAGSLLAIGDSPGGNDRALLKRARVKIAVHPKGDHLEVARSDPEILIFEPNVRKKG